MISTVPFSKMVQYRRTEFQATVGGVGALVKGLKSIPGTKVKNPMIKDVWAFSSDTYGPKRMLHGIGVTYESPEGNGTAELILLRTRATADRVVKAIKQGMKNSMMAPR